MSKGPWKNKKRDKVVLVNALMASGTTPLSARTGMALPLKKGRPTSKLPRELLPKPVKRSAKEYEVVSVGDTAPLIRADGSESALTFPLPFLREIDRVPREVMIEAMVELDTDATLRLLALLQDPANANVPISELADRCGIRVPELMEMWRTHMRISALGRTLAGIVDVMDDCVQDARSYYVCCTRCDGGGVMRVATPSGHEWLACKTCEGSGRERRPGDPKSREYALEIGGMIAQKSAPLVNVNFTSHANSVLDELEHMEQMERPAVNVTPISGDSGLDSKP